MSQPPENIPIHVIDFEGGSYGIIEYGIATLQHGQVTSCHTRLCRASGDIPAQDTWQHGLRRQDTEHCAPMNDDWALFNKLRQDGLFAAHHAPVENRLLKQVWPYPTEAPDFAQPGVKQADWGPWIDTRLIYRQAYPDLDNHKLGNLIQCLDLQALLDQLVAQHCPENRRKYHCALYDALASALLLMHLRQQPGYGRLPLSWLCQPGSAGTQGQLF